MLRAASWVLLAVLAAPLALAHGGERHDLDDQLVSNGRRLLVGSFDAPQPGPLALVPLVAQLDCAAPAHRLELGDGAGVGVQHDGERLRFHFDRPHEGFTMAAVDTSDAVRALLMMDEHAVALHALAASGRDPADPDGAVVRRAGTLGLPYRLPGASTHSLGHLAEGGGIAMSYSGDADAPCPGAVFDFRRADLPDALAPGSIVHAVFLFDPEVELLLPRPVDSTLVLQANLFLARPGDEAETVRRSLEPGIEPSDLGAVGLAVLVALAARRG